jgi:hypothetical protein
MISQSQSQDSRNDRTVDITEKKSWKKTTKEGFGDSLLSTRDDETGISLNLSGRSGKSSKSMKSFYTDRAQMGARNKHAHGIRPDKRGFGGRGTAGKGAKGD